VLGFKWSKALFILILFCLPCCADEYNLLNSVTLKQYPKGSFYVRYGGIRGAIQDQLISQLHSIHRDWVEFKYPNDFKAAQDERWEYKQRQHDINHGGAWFEREWWWENLPAIKGGAPDYPIAVYRGPFGNFIDVGVAYLTYDFRFKLREYNVSLTQAFENKEFSDLSPSADQWRFRFKPQVRFSSKTIIRQIRFGCFFEYSHNQIGLVSIEIFCAWRPAGAFVGGISIYLLQW